MPVYDFRCGCGNQRPDILVPSHSTPIYCSVCGNQMERLPAAPAFALKGAGFYANDSKVQPKPDPSPAISYRQAVSPERAFRE